MDMVTYALLRKKIKKLEEELENRSKFLGITTTELSDGATTNPIMIDGEEVTAKAGDWTIVYNDSDKEFAYNGSIWQEFGDISDLDYNALLNHPLINGVELVGDKSFEDLGQEDIANSRIKQIIDTQYDLIFGGGN